MKIITTKALCLACATFAFGFGGCATDHVADQESLLSAAGFKARTPTTAKQQDLYAKLPAHQMHRATVKGKVFYLYKDEAKGVAYVGGEKQYEEYQRLAVAKHIATDYYRAAELNHETAMGWYGAWGPSYLWW